MIDESVDIKYTQFTDWGSGFQGSIDITNNGDSSVNGWDLDFDLPREINDIWGANIISSDNGDYTIESLDWNSEIRPGQTINRWFRSQWCFLTSIWSQTKSRSRPHYSSSSRFTPRSWGWLRFKSPKF